MADAGTPSLFEQIDHAALLGDERVDARRLGVEKGRRLLVGQPQVGQGARRIRSQQAVIDLTRRVGRHCPDHATASVRVTVNDAGSVEHARPVLHVGEPEPRRLSARETDPVVDDL